MLCEVIGQQIAQPAKMTEEPIKQSATLTGDPIKQSATLTGEPTMRRVERALRKALLESQRRSGERTSKGGRPGAETRTLSPQTSTQTLSWQSPSAAEPRLTVSSTRCAGCPSNSTLCCSCADCASVRLTGGAWTDAGAAGPLLGAAGWAGGWAGGLAEGLAEGLGAALVARSAKVGSSSGAAAGSRVLGSRTLDPPGISEISGGAEAARRMRCGRGAPPKYCVLGSLSPGSSTRVYCSQGARPHHREKAHP